MQETGRYKLKKPDPSDYADIGALNGNADAIDGALAELEDGKADKTLVNVTNEDFKAKADAAGAGGVPPEMAEKLLYAEAPAGDTVSLLTDADLLGGKTLEQILTDTALTGSPTAPTPAQGDSSALIATTAFVSAALSGILPTLQTLVPAGVITMWSGAVGAVPSGWQLCDGTNGTPDLRGRFIVGAGGSYAVGDTGGEEKHTLTVNEMPRHNHSLNIYMQNASTSSQAADGTTSKTGSISTDYTGGGQSHENRPPYYALCYIMKV